MKTLSAPTWIALQKRDDDWVKCARELSDVMKGRDKERQLRNIQSLAEVSTSWEAVALFIRYQAARGQIDKEWAEVAIDKLGKLSADAKGIAGKDSSSSVHMQLVARVLGFAVRWYVWKTKGQENAQ